MRELLSGAAVSLLIRLIGIASQFAFNVLLGRWLGADGMGLYALAFAVCAFASVIGRMGMDILVVRFVAVHRSLDDRQIMTAGWRRAMVIVFMASAMITILVYGMADQLAEHVFGKPQLGEPIRWMALSITPFAMLNVVGESFRGLQDIARASLVQLGLVPFVTVSIFGLYGLVSATVGTAVLAYVSATIAVLGYSFWLFTKRIPRSETFSLTESVREHISVSKSLPMMWVSVTAVVMGLSDTGILGIYHPAQDVGVYSASLRLSATCSFILASINSILAPKVAALFKEGEITTVEYLCKRGTLITLACTAPLLVIFLFYPHFALRLFGTGFENGAPALIILSLGQLVNIGVGSVGIVLLMTGHARDMSHITAMALVTSIIGCFILIPLFGITGAAVANALALGIQNVIAMFMVMRRLQISTVPGIRIDRN